MIEIAEAMPDAFHGSAQNVTIADLTIEKYAGAQQHGAIQCTGGKRMDHNRQHDSTGITPAESDSVVTRSRSQATGLA